MNNIYILIFMIFCHIIDDYVLQSYGGFFTGAFVGLACVDYAGYNTVAEFRSFDYKEL